MKIGALELMVVFIVALIAIGPDKLPAYARKLGQALQEFRRVSADVTKDVRESVIEPLEEAQKPLREAMEPLVELDRAVRKDIKDLEKDFKDLGTAKPTEKKPAPETESTAEVSAELPPAEPQAAPGADIQPEETTETLEGESV